MATLLPVDDLRFGRAIRTARIRRGWRQFDLAAAARISRTAVSRIELGRFETGALASVRRVARVLDIRVELLPRARGPDLDRSPNARHAALAEPLVRRFDRVTA